MSGQRRSGCVCFLVLFFLTVLFIDFLPREAHAEDFTLAWSTYLGGGGDDIGCAVPLILTTITGFIMGIWRIPTPTIGISRNFGSKIFDGTVNGSRRRFSEADMENKEIIKLKRF